MKRIIEMWEDCRAWFKQKLCKHDELSQYEEFLTKDEGRFQWHWTACYACPKCGEITGVQASWYGNPFDVALSVDECIESWRPNE